MSYTTQSQIFTLVMLSLTTILFVVVTIRIIETLITIFISKKLTHSQKVDEGKQMIITIQYYMIKNKINVEEHCLHTFDICWNEFKNLSIILSKTLLFCIQVGPVIQIKKQKRNMINAKRENIEFSGEWQSSKDSRPTTPNN